MTRQKHREGYRDERAAEPGKEWNEKRKSRRRRKRRKARIRFLASMLGTLLGAVLLVLVAYTALNLFCGFGKVNTQKLQEQGYPESLIALVERNPETKDFVLDYPKYKGLEEIDISKEVTKGEIPHFLQWDERWGYETYGSDFLAVTGCGPTSLSMVVCGLTGDTKWNPYEVAKMAEDNGYYVDGSGSSWELMSSGAEKLGLTVSNVIFDTEHIRATLEAGQPIICVMGRDFTDAGHFLVLTGVDQEGNIILQDPNSVERTKQHWDVQKLMNQMKNSVAYRV
ncbi:MAG: C39 family peptidase [Eubacteriales bacterium]